MFITRTLKLALLSEKERLLRCQSSAQLPGKSNGMPAIRHPDYWIENPNPLRLVEIDSLASA